MRPLVHTLTSIPLLLLITGCALIEQEGSFKPPNSECDNQPPRINWERFSQNPSLLWGSWSWMKTTYYFTVEGKPLVVTPCSAGYTETLVFQKKGYVEVYRSDTLVYRQPLQELLSGTVWGVNRDSLIISTALRDGPESMYVRKWTGWLADSTSTSL
jgi:hypothetical protein